MIHIWINFQFQFLGGLRKRDSVMVSSRAAFMKHEQEQGAAYPFRKILAFNPMESLTSKSHTSLLIYYISN